MKYGFEGGQTPFYKRMRKYGFTNKPHLREYAPLNLSRLQFWIDTGRIDASQKITMKTLLDSGCVGRLRKLQKGIKLLGDVRRPVLSFHHNYHLTALSHGTRELRKILRSVPGAPASFSRPFYLRGYYSW